MHLGSIWDVLTVERAEAAFVAIIFFSFKSDPALGQAPEASFGDFVSRPFLPWDHAVLAEE
jgi:hypothetical protein